MNQSSPRTRRVLSIAALSSVALFAGLAGAHDEDWRKLLDKIGPVEGPIWTLGDPVARDGGFDASGVTCLAHIPPNNFSGATTEAQDCWGYVSPSGREYAIVCLSNGFGFVEITDPINPVIIDFVGGAISSWHDVKVIGSYAYGVSEGGLGVQVMDLTDIDNGNVTLVRNAQNGGHSTTHNIIANTDAGTLWLAGANIGNGGLVHMDLSNPTNPFPSGGFTQDGYTHDAQVVSYRTTDPDGAQYGGREIAFLANEDTVTIADVTNPANTTQIARRTYSGSAYTHQLWLSDDRTLLYMNDELDEQFGTVSTTTTRVFDVSNLDNPVLVSSFTTGLPSVDHNLYVRDGYIFMANYRSGLRVFDANTDPLNPTEIAYFDTFPGSDSASFNGAWSTYPYFPSGNVIVSDIERGLFVLRVDALDLDRLELDLASNEPDLVSPNGTDSISLQVNEINLTADAATAEMIFDDGSGPVSVPGTPAGGGVFDFAFPTADCGDATYYFSIADTLGETFMLPGNAPADVFTTVIADGLVTEFADNFQTNTGWSVSGSAADAGSGRWERANPGGDGSRGDPADDADGSGICYVTGNGGPGSNTDVDATTVLTSPAFDVSAMPEAVVRYQRWYNNAAGSNPGVETMEVEISNNNGASWSPLETVGPTGAAASGGWLDAEFRVADFVTPTANVRVRFTATDDIGSVVEAGVDDFEVFEYVCDPAPACFADCDGNGSLNVDDVDCFVAAFLGSDLGGADCDGNGSLNVDDVDCFVAGFLGGCP
ncbi:MAG: choice-of-anchor B family protein [Phycisphaerales bacterium]